MKCYLKYIFNCIFIQIVLSFILLISGCSKTETEIKNQFDNDTQLIETSKKDSELQTDEINTESQSDEYSDYLAHLQRIPSLQTYYKIVFAFENLPDGIESVPITKVKNMYYDLNSNFEYIGVGVQPLLYTGEYIYDTKFVDGYEEFLKSGNSANAYNPINIPAYDLSGNEYMVTPLKSVAITENTAKYFESKVNYGRNFNSNDFKLTSREDNISVLLGDGYKDIFDVGDTFTLELIADMNFKVVGFLKENESFIMEEGLFGEIELDNVIIIPQFIPDYEPIGDREIHQHAFIIAELTSGYVRVYEPISEINNELHKTYVDRLKSLEIKNELEGLYLYPTWIVGFDWS